MYLRINFKLVLLVVYLYIHILQYTPNLIKYTLFVKQAFFAHYFRWRTWTLDADCTHVLYIHTRYIYVLDVRADLLKLEHRFK